MKMMHRILTFIIPLFLIALGLGIYFYLTSEPLSEKQFTHKGRQFSILVPRTFQYKDTSELAVWGKGEEILIVSLALAERKETKILTCNDFKTQGAGTYYAAAETAFTADIKSLGKNVEICMTPDPDTSGYMVLDALGLEDSNTRYLLAVNAKEDFIKTSKGQGKVKKIFESFKIRP